MSTKKAKYQFKSATSLGSTLKIKPVKTTKRPRSRSAKRSSPKATPFQPIGMGKPLLVRFHTLYVGKLPGGVLKKKRRSILITSQIKDDTTYEAAPRGVHQIYQAVTEKDTLYPEAGNIGTGLIYYTPAFDEGMLLFDIEVKLDRFSDELVKNVLSVAKKAQGLPIFAPFAPYIMAGSKLVKIGNSFAKKAIDNKPILNFQFDMYENMGGFKNPVSDFYVGHDSKQEDEFEGYAPVVKRGKVRIEKDGKAYQGDHPYIIISIDGAEVERYNNFKATIASASLLKQFYGSQNEEENISAIYDMLQLTNDHLYLKKIKDAQKKLKRVRTDKKKEEISYLINTYEKHIQNEDLLKIIGDWKEMEKEKEIEKEMEK